MADAFVQLVSIQPSQSTKAGGPQGPGSKSLPHGGQTMKGGLYSDRRKKACTVRK